MAELPAESAADDVIIIFELPRPWSLLWWSIAFILYISVKDIMPDFKLIEFHKSISTGVPQISAGRHWHGSGVSR
jgi:hypothetical protein